MRWTTPDLNDQRSITLLLGAERSELGGNGSVHVASVSHPILTVA